MSSNIDKKALKRTYKDAFKQHAVCLKKTNTDVCKDTDFAKQYGDFVQKKKSYGELFKGKPFVEDAAPMPANCTSGEVAGINNDPPVRKKVKKKFKLLKRN